MLSDFLTWCYPWTKALHILAVISWMAGIFYLPRLFVHHAEKGVEQVHSDEMLQMMELKLLRVIMNPAMIATWIFGIMLALTPGIIDWGAIWPYAKFASVGGLTWFHHWLGKRRKDFANGANVVSGRTYRMMNEVPTLLLVIIVVAVVVRPF
ncbi:protoporphyrinogen oxidase HemJ [Vannielia litorea]|uniref:protoporphyrinogen oxidase HemJ n=1 Tax=Vannielia litorea TaxID=1217970 RepID=UPI001C937893|nr:protoporphyrinogen oxidase HemJ [Vannielia litorea]MBY6154956.1 protoporphyrinogen oxidase HemJ [Vannielia litorea]